MPFPLLEFISFGLSSLNSEVYFPMRDLFAPCGADGSYISPGPLQRPGDFFARPRETSLRVRPCVRSARCRRTFSSPILPIPDPPGPFHQSIPSARPFSATVPRHPRLRPRPPPAARNTVPFTPSPRPASPRPATLPRNHPTTPPRTGRQARFAPPRSRSGP